MSLGTSRYERAERPAGTPLNAYAITYDRAAIDQYLARSGEPIEPYIYGGQLTVPPGMFLGGSAQAAN